MSGKVTKTDLERFEAKYTIAENGCWIWTGAKKDGYGKFRFKGDIWFAHRVALVLYQNLSLRSPSEQSVDKKEDLHACHTCDTPSCVNPEHLFLGTAMDNMHDMIAKDRQVLATYHSNEANACTKYSDETVQEIRDLYLTGKYTYQQLANLTGMSKPNVAKIVTNKIRPKVEEQS